MSKGTRNFRRRAQPQQKACIYCNKEMDFATTDHVVPKGWGMKFEYHPHNYVLCCKKCNEQKANTMWVYNSIPLRKVYLKNHSLNTSLCNMTFKFTWYIMEVFHGHVYWTTSQM